MLLLAKNFSHCVLVVGFVAVLEIHVLLFLLLEPG
jgi:hypothetical protein